MQQCSCMWNMQRWCHQNPNLLQLSISGQLWKPSISGHGYTSWNKENYYRVVITGLTSRQPWYEHHSSTPGNWQENAVHLSLFRFISLSVQLFQLCECLNTTALMLIYHTPHLPIQSYYKTSNPPAYMPFPPSVCLSCFSCLFSIVVPPKKSMCERTSSLPLQTFFLCPLTLPLHFLRSPRGFRVWPPVSLWPVSLSRSLSLLSSFSLSQGCR